MVLRYVQVKLMIKFKDYLSERKQVGNLYHFTQIIYLPAILKSKKLETPKWTSYVSFTRNKILPNTNPENWKYATVRLTIDGDKLSDKYKIKPYSYFKSPLGSEDEERIKNKSVDIKILAIDVLYGASEYMEDMGYEYFDLNSTVELQELLNKATKDLEKYKSKIKYVNSWK